MKELFKNLGASEKEAETFLKLLELGAQPASVIARHTTTPRSTMYLILENLKKLSLIEEFSRAKIKYFKCIRVKDLPDVIKAKENNLKHTAELLSSSLLALESIENKLSITPKIKFYEGKEEVMKMYEEVLKEKSFCAIFNSHVDNPIMEIYLRKVPEIVKKEKINARELIVDGPKAKKYKKECTSKNHKIKILPKQMKFDSDNFILNDRVYMVSYDAKDVSAVKIESVAQASTQKALFEQLWGSL